MARERWVMVLVIALVVGCAVLALNASSKAQGGEGRYALEVVAVDSSAVAIVVLDTATGQASVYRDYPGSLGGWSRLGAP